MKTIFLRSLIRTRYKLKRMMFPIQKTLQFIYLQMKYSIEIQSSKDVKDNISRFKNKYFNCYRNYCHIW